MTERKSIKVPVEWYEEHKPKKEDAGLTWAEYLSDERVATIEYTGVDYDRIGEIVHEKNRELIEDLSGDGY